MNVEHPEKISWSRHCVKQYNVQVDFQLELLLLVILCLMFLEDKHRSDVMALQAVVMVYTIYIYIIAISEVFYIYFVIANKPNGSHQSS